MVAPLRKGYDDLGESLTTIDGDADALASATAALERQVAALSQYVQRTPEAELSKSELLTTLRARKAAVTSAHASLAEGPIGLRGRGRAGGRALRRLMRSLTAFRKQIDKALTALVRRYTGGGSGA